MYIRVLMENTTTDPQLACEHGLSLYIVTGGKRILFDAGQSESFADNAAKLGIDLAAVDLCILSHGHYDHSGGLMQFLQLNPHAPVYMHRLAVEPHYNQTNRYIGIDARLLETGRIRFTGDEHPISDSLCLCTCAGREARHPHPPSGLSVDTGQGFAPDTFAHEQYLVVQESRRRIVISGCSHKGVLNLLDWLDPDVLIGGFHFARLSPEHGDGPFLEQAARAMLQSRCTFYTGHCTGEANYVFLKRRMGRRLHALRSGYAYIL